MYVLYSPSIHGIFTVHSTNAGLLVPEFPDVGMAKTFYKHHIDTIQLCTRTTTTKHGMCRCDVVYSSHTPYAYLAQTFLHDDWCVIPKDELDPDVMKLLMFQNMRTFDIQRVVIQDTLLTVQGLRSPDISQDIDEVDKLHLYHKMLDIYAEYS